MTALTYVPPVAIDLPEGTRLRRTTRSARTMATFARHLGPVLVDRARKRPADSVETGRRLRSAFDELGSTYLKFGQLIGSSPGAFGPALADQFRGCLDTGPSVAFSSVRNAVESVTGGPLDATFASFSTEAIASASMAVVHEGVLHDGRRVAVKVLRPGIAEQVAIDLDVMEPLFKLLALRGVGIAGPLYRFLRGFRVQVAEELDLRNEARTMTHFASLFADAGLERIVVPVPIPELSGVDVLVMGFLDGVAIDDLTAIEEMGHDPAPLVQDLLKSWFLTGLRFGMFHGDIHAGNLMLLRDGRIGMIDWGIVGRLDGPTHKLFRRFVEAVLGDATAWPEIVAFLSEMGPFAPEDGDDEPRGIPDEAREEIEAMLTRPFGEVDLTGAFSGPGDGPMGSGRRVAKTKAEKKARKARVKQMRKRVIGSGFADTGFAQANFMLFKQLLYFERYGKLYLADSALDGRPRVPPARSRHQPCSRGVTTATAPAARDHRRSSFVGLALARIGTQPYGLVMGSYLTLLVATRASTAVAITFATTAHKYLSFFVFPAAGRLSDRTQASFGRRVPYMVGGLVVAAIAVWLFPVVPGYWALVAVIVIAREAAIVQRVARFAVTPDVFGRSRWVRAVLSMGLVTLLPGFVVLGVIRFTWHQDDPSTWGLTYRLAAVGLLVAAVATGLWVREAPASQVAAERAAATSWRAELRALLEIPNAKVLLVAGVLLGAAGAATSRLFPVWANHVLGAGAPELVDISVLTTVLGVIAAVPGVFLASRAHPRTLAVSAAVVGALAAAAHVFVTELWMFAVAATVAVPLAVAAIVAGIPILLRLVPPGESLGESIGLFAGPFSLLTSVAAYASAVLVDASGDYRLIWLVAAVFTAGAALALVRLEVPEGEERTDVRGLLREARAGGSGGLFAGTVAAADVLGDEEKEGVAAGVDDFGTESQQGVTTVTLAQPGDTHRD